jgi:hypothetical protein
VTRCTRDQSHTAEQDGPLVAHRCPTASRSLPQEGRGHEGRKGQPRCSGRLLPCFPCCFVFFLRRAFPRSLFILPHLRHPHSSLFLTSVPPVSLFKKAASPLPSTLFTFSFSYLSPISQSTASPYIPTSSSIILHLDIGLLNGIPLLIDCLRSLALSSPVLSCPVLYQLLDCVLLGCNC